jgi:hypothetical protein
MSKPAFDRDEEVAGLVEERHGNAGRRLGTDRRKVDDFSKVVTTVGVAAAVWIGVVGCAYPVHQWTNIDRGAAVQLASEMQQSCFVGAPPG